MIHPAAAFWLPKNTLIAAYALVIYKSGIRQKLSLKWCSHPQ